MNPGMRQVYFYLILLGFAGYLWIGWVYFNIESNREPLVGCLIKSVTGLPCPSCGTTRSVIHLVSGDFIGSLKTNPLGVISFTALLFVPFWALWDISMGQIGLIRLYRKAEILFRKPVVFIPFIALMLLNWVWGISKGL